MRIVPRDYMRELESICPKGILKIQTFQFEGPIEEEKEEKKFRHCKERIMNIRFKTSEEVLIFLILNNNYIL